MIAYKRNVANIVLKDIIFKKYNTHSNLNYHVIIFSYCNTKHDLVIETMFSIACWFSIIFTVSLSTLTS